MELSSQDQGLPQKESITIKIAQDKMSATIIFHSPQNEGKILTREEIEDYIRIERITQGIDQELLNELVESKSYEIPYTIAKGIDATKPQDGQVIYKFNTNKNVKPKEKEDGTVDFYDLNLIENVHEGDVLAEILLPIEGEEGYNVLGETIFPVKGKHANPKRGRNVGISEDGTKLIAQKAGQVSIIDEKVVVNEIYEVPSDVSTSTGNINFVGSIVVKGNVLTGFRVYASGNIDVHGVVEGAIIEAKGNVNLHRGVLGGGKAEIKAGGDIVAKYIENSKISADGNIMSEAILHSEVRCSGNLEIGGKNGLLVGGSIMAGRSIKAKVIGSNLGTHTEIKVGVDPNLAENYKRDKEEIDRLTEERRKTYQLIEVLESRARKNLLDEEKLQLLDKMVKTSKTIERRIEELIEEQELLKQKIEEIENGDIKVEQKICPNVEIYISTAYLRTKEEIHRCTLRKSGADVKISSY